MRLLRRLFSRRPKARQLGDRRSGNDRRKEQAPKEPYGPEDTTPWGYTRAGRFNSGDQRSHRDRRSGRADRRSGEDRRWWNRREGTTTVQRYGGSRVFLVSRETYERMVRDAGKKGESLPTPLNVPAGNRLPKVVMLPERRAFDAKVGGLPVERRKEDRRKNK